MLNHNNFKVKIISIFIVVLLIISVVSPVLFYPWPANAQWVVTNPVSDVLRYNIFVSEYMERAGEIALEKADKALETIKKDIGALAWRNALSTFLNKIAYDTAVWIGSGDKGQKPLLFTSDWGTYLKDAGESAAADYIATFGEQAGLGNICTGPDALLKISVSLGVAQQEIRKPTCTWKDLKENWDITDPKFLEKFSFEFDPTQNDMGIAIDSFLKLEDKKADAEAQARLEREGKAFKDNTELLSKFITTPGTFIEEQAKLSQREAGDQFFIYTGSVIADSIGIFAKTLMGQLLKKLQKGMWSLADIKKEKVASTSTGVGTGTTGDRKAVEKTFGDILKPTIKTSGEFDILTEFETCPEAFANINNCVIDSDFATILRQEGLESALTVREAIERDLLHGNWPFGFIDLTGQIEPDYLSGYAYSNMIKLRRARAIPIGWELAAQKVLQVGKVTTLKDVVDAFNDPASPFYRLVDPDWVLKIPKTKCQALTYGEMLQPESANRYENCVDIKDCVAEDEKGSCRAWGYCTREKRSWNFNGDQCPSYYNTCQHYTKIANNQEFYFLENTLDKDACNASNAGCKWYSLTQNGAGNWSADSKIYFNKNVETCDSKFNGCHLYKKLTNIRDNLTIEQVLNEVLGDPNKADDYTNYAEVKDLYLNGNRLMCSADEVGCDNFTPINNDPPITAVGQARDICPVECVGYQTFKQEKTYLEKDKFPVYFIAKTAVACDAAQVGCDQFTNLDVVAAGGEGIEYYSYLRQCQKPAPFNQDRGNYYTWQGSDTTGYQLVAYSLKAVNADGTGAPKTIDGSAECENKADPECKEFYDEAGNIYYREYKKTITCSSDCHPYRKTVSSGDDCSSSNGSWDEITSQCSYMAISNQGITCDATASGCRSYVGNAGTNINQVMSDDFEDGDTFGWSSGAISTESIKFGGRSMKFNTNNQYLLGNLFNQNKAYTISFWFKNSVTIPTTINVKVGPDLTNPDRTTDLAFGSFTTYTTDWNIYTLGPLIFSRPAATDDRLIFEISGASDVFIDNVILKEVEQNVYLIKNSWKTPASCETDPPLEGGTASSSMLGCQGYKDSQNQVHYYKSFSRLCTSDKVHCEALIDTKNSVSPYEEIFNPGTSSVTVPADSIAYVVNDKDKYCPKEEKGCSKLGLPAFKADGTVSSYSEIYFRNNPDKYRQILCLEVNAGCEEYASGSGLVYFKDPGEKICERRIKEGQVQMEYAWFKKGDSTPNPIECLNATSNEWVLSCDSENAGCTQFYEPITQESYYYINNERINRAACNGVVDWKKGCVLFDDKSIATHYYESGTDTAYIGSPLSCSDPADPKCNTNSLLKVNLDRACAEWFSCLAGSSSWDAQKGEYRNVCYAVGRCHKSSEDSISTCEDWVFEPEPVLLNEAFYKARSVTWGDWEYSGYSIPNIYPLEKLRQKSYSTDASGNPSDFRLTYFDQGVDKGIDGQGNYSFKGCRGYPEADSPVPYNVAEFDHSEENYGAIKSKATGFENANVSYEYQDADCSYQKISYQNGEKRYYALGVAPDSIIKRKPSGGGELQEFRINQRNISYGWRGYCLEYDPGRQLYADPTKRACLTWWPIDLILGETDIYNDTPKAGFVASGGSDYYCAESRLMEYRHNFDSCSEGYHTCPSGYIEVTSGSSTCSSSGHKVRSCSVPQPTWPGFPGSCEFGCYFGPVVEGWYEYNGSLDTSYEREAGIKQLCTVMVRIQDDNQRNKAYTSRVTGDFYWDYANPSITPLIPNNFILRDYPLLTQDKTRTDLNYLYKQQNKPFGAMYITEDPKVSPFRYIVRSSQEFSDCPGSECIDVRKDTQTGVCEAGVDKGKPCPSLPNAGSPYALYVFAGSFINTSNVKMRLYQDASKIPYVKSELSDQGVKRLQLLFAKTYGAWEWQTKAGICQGYCSGSGLVCSRNDDCNKDPSGVYYQCLNDACIGGINEGLTCSPHNDCKNETIPESRYCVYDVAVKGYYCKGTVKPCNPNRQCLAPRTTETYDCNREEFSCTDGICSGGNRKGQSCQTDNDCSEDFKTCKGGVKDGQYCEKVEECAPETLDGFCPYNETDPQLPSTKRYCIAYSGGNVYKNGSASGQDCSTTPCPLTTTQTCNGPYQCSAGGSACNYPGEPCPLNMSIQTSYQDKDLKWDIGSTGELPKIMQTIYNVTSRSYSQGGAGISVNNKTSGNVEGIIVLPVQVTFYAYNANGEQMPLKYVEVNWNDGSDVSASSGSLKNHKHVCNRYCNTNIKKHCSRDDECVDLKQPTLPGRCIANNFGDTIDACTEDTQNTKGYFVFTHVYICDPTKAVNGQCSFPGPSVRVRDNFEKETILQYPGSMVISLTR